MDNNDYNNHNGPVKSIVSICFGGANGCAESSPIDIKEVQIYRGPKHPLNWSATICTED